MKKKHLFTVLVGFLFASFTFAQDVSGVWEWAGAGCRNRSNLSSESHVTKPSSENPFKITASQLTLNSDLSASMWIEHPDGGVQRETGTYTVENNKVIINDPDLPAEDNPVFPLHIVDGDLILALFVDDDSAEPLDADIATEAERICGAGNTYVYVFVSL